MWKQGSWHSKVPLSSEKIKHSHHMIPINGTFYFVNIIYSRNTLISQSPWLEDLMLEYKESMRWQPQTTVHLYINTQKLINKSLTRNSKRAATSAHVLMMKLRPLLGPSNHLHFPWFRNQGCLDASEQFIIFPTLIFVPHTSH